MNKIIWYTGKVVLILAVLAIVLASLKTIIYESNYFAIPGIILGLFAFVAIACTDPYDL